jgi:hypothetical protein
MKWLWIGLGFVAISLATAGYVLNSGAPAAPTGACPALVSAAPYDANLVAYVDFASLRSAALSEQFDSLEKMPQAAAYRDFVEKTNFHIDRDLDHILLTASADSQGVALVLEGRFDHPQIAAFAANAGSIRHYGEGDVYQFRAGNTSTGTSMIFLGPNRLAFAMGPGADTEILMLADAVKGSEASLHEALCGRAERVAGAPFFIVGDVPKSAASQIMPVLTRQNPEAAEIVQALRGWDVAYWIDGDSVRLALEGEFESRYDALEARVDFQKLREAIEKGEPSLKAGPMAANPAAPVLDTIVKNLAISVDGRYVRMESVVKKSDLEALAAASANRSRL